MLYNYNSPSNVNNYDDLYMYPFLIKIAENDTGFFPQEEACFKNKDATGQKLDKLYDQVKGILQRLKEKVKK